MVYRLYKDTNYMSKDAKTVDNKGAKQGYPPRRRAIRIKSISDARRLLSRLIFQLQGEEIESRFAKDLCYLAISYVNIARDSDIESRLDELEQKVIDNEKS